MTFDEAIEAALDNKIVAREGWDDPERVAYMVPFGTHMTFMNVNIPDHEYDDWYVVGSIH